jgi:predicted nucleic acid-binding protein
VIIVSNTGPIIGLAKVRHLDLLSRLAPAVFVPPQVQIELLAKPGPETLLITAALGKTIQVKAPPPMDPAAEMILRPLDEGERQAIALARSLLPSVLLLLDDRLGRSAARRLRLSLTGLAGLLLLAKRRNLIPSVSPLLASLRSSGYWVSDAVVNTVIHLAGE